MKGFNPTLGHIFQEPFITYHLLRAEDGAYESARWLRDGVRNALKAGVPVDPHVLLAVKLLQKGGLRRSRQVKGRGKRGKALGDHNQLLYAREMWKQIKLAGYTFRDAATEVAKNVKRDKSSVINAYYRFAKTNAAEYKVFIIELKRDYFDCPAIWKALAKNPAIVARQVDALSKLPSF